MCEYDIDKHRNISAKGDVLEKKILSHGVKVWIISCDSEEMLKLRTRDELSGGRGDDAVVKVKGLEQYFALSFKSNGKGGKYFAGYFDELWEDSAHAECRL